MFRFGVLLCLVGLVVAMPPLAKSREEIEAFRNFLIKTKTGDGNNFVARTQQSPLANPEENSGRFQGDIVLDDFMIEDMVNNYAIGKNAYIYPGTKWPNNTITWQFGGDEFNSTKQDAIRDGIAQIEKNTCLKFRYKEPEDTIFVNVTGNPAGCYSDVGYWEDRGAHTVNLAPNGCIRLATIVHEFMHVIGFFHMQTTFNRDDYVIINEENIIPGLENNFEVLDSDLVSNLGVDYEYVSVMHYGPFAFSSNKLPTIVAKQTYEGTMGQRVYITDKDWLRVNRHYDCPGAWDEKKDDAKNCDGNNFVARTQQSPLANPEENSGRFQGDIVLDDFMIEDMVNNYAIGKNAYIYPGTKWPNNTITWQFGGDEFNSTKQDAIRDGIAQIEKNTCLKFRYKEPEDTIFVNVTGNPAGCYSDVGYWEDRGVHTVNLAPNGCIRLATIVHEFMHVIGFFHMQTTFNRDDYVIINEENIIPGLENNFEVLDSDLVSNLGVDYEYVSVMHYGPFAFSSNKLPTIVAKQTYEGTMGQRVYITDKDWLRVNRHYDCPGAWDEKKDDAEN